MKCVKIELKKAEKAKKELIKLGVFSSDYCVSRDKNYVYFPVSKKVGSFSYVEKKLKKVRKENLDDLLSKKLTKKELELVKKSFDVVGSIGVLEIDDKLLKKKKIIADALIKTNKNIKTVVRKVGEHKGKYRIQDCEFLVGSKKFETLHRESGVLVNLDVRKVYFSPRLSTERVRVSKACKSGERVLVVGSGVGIYPLVISKHSKVKEVCGVEVNPYGHKYGLENIKLNKLENIKLYKGDIVKIISKLGKFGRIVIAMPKNSKDFLTLVLKHLKKNGFIHFYCFSSEEDIKEVVDFVKKKCKCRVLRKVKCGQISPRIFRYCLDLGVLD